LREQNRHRSQPHAPGLDPGVVGAGRAIDHGGGSHGCPPTGDHRSRPVV